MENKYKRKTDGNGLFYLLLGLLQAIALREAYIGNEQWWLVPLIAIPLLLLYVLLVRHLKKVRNMDGDSKQME